MIKVETLADFIRLHYAMKDKDHQRMGQRFVNMYVKEPSPDLFHETNDHKAVDKISTWLTRYHYINQDHLVNVLPPVLPSWQALQAQHTKPAAQAVK